MSGWALRPLGCMGLCFLGLAACRGSSDADGDGLSLDEEIALRSDPLNADSDGDGLLDGAEARLGTHPLAVDTDGDGYLDPWEVWEGVDPLDPEARIYSGDYPYNPDKDKIVPSQTTHPYRVGDVVQDVVFDYDRFQEPVHLHDFGGQGVPVVLSFGSDVSVSIELVRWLSTGVSNWRVLDGLDDVRDAVADGRILWIHALRAELEPEHVERRSEAIGHAVPVVAYSGDTWDRFRPSAVPALFVLDENMRLQDIGNGGRHNWFDVMVELNHAL